MRKLKSLPATARQIERMNELGIGFDSDVTLEEAAELIRPHLRPAPAVSIVPESALVEFSEQDKGWS